MNAIQFRDQIVARLVEDLVGPMSPTEVVSDRPTQRYSTGILYPRDSNMEPAEDEDGGLAINVSDDAASQSDDSGVSLHAALKPAAAGLSFAVRSDQDGATATIQVDIECATYVRIAVDNENNEIEGEPRDRAHERWRRCAHSASVAVGLQAGQQRIDLAGLGISGVELYALVTPHAGTETVTLAISNQLNRGSSSAYDEAQHFFQVRMAVRVVSGGAFAPRPSRIAQTDEDSRTAALIYRDVKEYVVGHTCSGRATLERGVVVRVETDWVPTVLVKGTSDRGDAAFEELHRAVGGRDRLDANWLAVASSTDLVRGLEDLVSAYRGWIDGETARIPAIPGDLRAQAVSQLDQCRRGADRMDEGIAAIRDDVSVREAFQLAQLSMAKQYAWSKANASLKWRPFQLAFQLLVLPSLADRSHADRQTMDLLWFPTGGGKTEAYLALTAFIIMLRRLRPTATDDGAGVAVLMRYTLRLLTVQQFQRAAAMVSACELLRRRAEMPGTSLPRLGHAPIGIGLWVGAAATPLTIREALDRTAGDPSTPEQLTLCPCCGSRLEWRIAPQGSTVRCPSERGSCEFAESGERLPVWTIDEEVYRHAPSLLIGTVDKFAQIVRKQETRVIFGRGTKSAPPDLIIQDELHLISGPLGSMAGLYEVAIDELCRDGAVLPKVIGSTATIRRAESQIRALFDRGTYQFPAPGIDADNSGFAIIDRAGPGRIYVGLTTAGRSATYMLQAIVASLLQAATQADAIPEARDHYWTLVAYFNSLRELGRALVLMQDDVPVSVGQFAARRDEQRRRIEAPAELTSRVSSYEVREMLDRLGKVAGDSEAVDLLVASNMISVGMDIPRLGMMLVNAQPKTLSEYIQATSRVGRGQVPGLVVTMYNSMRTRDRSRFETFETWHRCLYRDVEATSVTPFASRAQDKALHAVLVALVRHLVTGMETRPILDDLRRAEAEQIATLIESRAARVDPLERSAVAQKLADLIQEWSGRPDLQAYWDDYGRRTSLLMSAEQYAAKADADPDLDTGGLGRALWPTPNSMREVEPGAPFVLRNVLKTEGA